MRELSVTKQRDKVLLAVVADGLTVTEVAKDWLVIRGGFNVFPRDVENALLEHPDVAVAGVVCRPYMRLGEEVVAFVSLKTGTQAREEELGRVGKVACGRVQVAERGTHPGPGALDAGGQSRTQSVAKNGCMDNHYPRGEGLATSPGRRARLRFHSPVLHVRRRRCGLA
jgi:hypothetical protein